MYLDIYDGDKVVRFGATLVLNHAKYVSPSSQKEELDKYMDSLYQKKTGRKLHPYKGVS